MSNGLAFAVSGKVIRIDDQRSGQFPKIYLIVQIADGNYSQDLCIEFWGDRVAQAAAVKVGQTVEVDLNVRGREYVSKKTGKPGNFTSLSAWRMKLIPESAPVGEYPAPEEMPHGGITADDIPF